MISGINGKFDVYATVSPFYPAPLPDGIGTPPKSIFAPASNDESNREQKYAFVGFVATSLVALLFSKLYVHTLLIIALGYGSTSVSANPFASEPSPAENPG